MVATTDVGFPIRLEGLVASDQASFCNYEPELFPGLIYKLQSPKICFLIFVSGKVCRNPRTIQTNACQLILSLYGLYEVVFNRAASRTLVFSSARRSRRRTQSEDSSTFRMVVLKAPAGAAFSTSAPRLNCLKPCNSISAGFVECGMILPPTRRRLYAVPARARTHSGDGSITGIENAPPMQESCGVSPSGNRKHNGVVYSTCA